MKYPCGTAQYMPPEMFTKKIYNRTTDWWALGVVIFQMAVGKLPFTGNRQQLRENIVNKQPNYPGWLDYNTNGIIRALLNKDNKARLGSLKYDSEQVMRYRYFKPMNWKALMKRELKAPFIPGPYVKSTAATEGQKAGDAATPPEFMWPVHLEVQEAFREFDELPKAP
ncbi:hypothetical protein XELAEV_18002691mg [Xenopus laevis]|uniref:Protein kinase domain-containing protein n=1 Tax=Xenopus laevis TaxID=8355 RepID=A0A974GZ51_XENLA|nr:hypothetical protein XELAEV_18000058mg [Xenopus laevis]OCT58028.1 hypothetical protein XELAEV_18002691mg [Xenopus laevis]